MRRERLKPLILSRRSILARGAHVVGASAVATGSVDVGLHAKDPAGCFIAYDEPTAKSARVRRAVEAASAASPDRAVITELVSKWAIWRDAGDWERFRTVWHDDGVMEATWTQGTVDEFIEASKKGWSRGESILHFLGGTAVDLTGDRAIAETKMTISQRAGVEGVECDVVCTGRFYDLFERRGRRWGMVYRQPIYEKDRLDPVDPAATPKLDRVKLDGYPYGYRHLAYLQAGLGYEIKNDMPGLKGIEVEELYRRGRAWLQGEPLLKTR